jgi:ornithine carbamoyltransferase
MARHLMSMGELKKEEILSLVKNAREIKTNPGKYARSLEGKTLLMMFEKPSLRTRVSFEVGMTQLGGHAIYYSMESSHLGKKETVSDAAKTACRYVDIVMIRAGKQSVIREFAANSSVPVIDALSDYAHPCQIMADLETMQERGKNLEKMKLCYLGNGNNNMTYDYMRAGAVLGCTVHVGCPEGDEYNVEAKVIEECEALAKKSGAKVVVTHDAAAAVKDADVVCTDTWINMPLLGQKQDVDAMMAERKKKLMPYQVDSAKMALAKKDAIFMNCLPAMRGAEQTAEVIDGPQSVVFDEAENRLHAQKAIMLWLLGKLG